jgi:hypothetical protein
MKRAGVVLGTAAYMSPPDPCRPTANGRRTPRRAGTTSRELVLVQNW